MNLVLIYLGVKNSRRVVYCSYWCGAIQFYQVANSTWRVVAGSYAFGAIPPYCDEFLKEYLIVHIDLVLFYQDVKNFRSVFDCPYLFGAIQYHQVAKKSWKVVSGSHELDASLPAGCEKFLKSICMSILIWSYSTRLQRVLEENCWLRRMLE